MIKQHDQPTWSTVSWPTQAPLSDWLRGLTCEAFRDRIVAGPAPLEGALQELQER